MFDFWSDPAALGSCPSPTRSAISYHLTLTIDGQPTMHGWWEDRAVADRKFLSWIGDYGSTASARITLTDQPSGQKLATWP
ncbi:hypothetical protein ABZ208_37680 [Streptomyces sp. NPDC006208]|uniref:hypothetical protein n=1 Tax=Streptomyces sp. NPDC006208 TaxID=3156734 RepID=UPI0033B82A24